MKVAVLTFEGFNELDSFIASAMLNRAKIQALIVCPSERVASLNGVVVHSQAPLSLAREADGVIVGSGIGAQCSGAVLAKLGLLADVPACGKDDYVARARVVLETYLKAGVPA